MTAGGAGIIVEFPDEPVTGADMEWNFVNRDDGTFFRILLQAKQAYGDGSIWTRHCYKELLHTSGSGTTPQAVILCNTSRTDPATYPLYILYHSERTCALASGAGFPNVTGVSLADGYAIERLVTASTTRKLRTRNKSVGHIAPLLTPLSSLFCPSTILPVGPMAFAPGFIPFPLFMGRSGGRTMLGRAIPHTPKDVRDRVVALSSTAAGTDAPSDEALAFVPEVSNEVPYEIRHLMEGHREGFGKSTGLRRWRVTFVSANSPSFEG